MATISQIDHILITSSANTNDAPVPQSLLIDQTVQHGLLSLCGQNLCEFPTEFPDTHIKHVRRTTMHYESVTYLNSLTQGQPPLCHYTDSIFCFDKTLMHFRPYFLYTHLGRYETDHVFQHTSASSWVPSAPTETALSIGTIPFAGTIYSAW